MDVADVRADLIAEQQALDDIVAEFSTEDWTAATPSPRWTVADIVAEPLTVHNRELSRPERMEKVAWLLEKVGLTGEQGPVEGLPPPDVAPDAGAVVRIKPLGRLIQEENLRPGHQTAGQLKPPLHAAGIARHLAVEDITQLD